MFFYADNMRSAAHRCGRNVCTAGGRGRPPLRMRIQKPSPLGTSDGNNARPQVPPAQSCPPCVREGGSRSETEGLLTQRADVIRPYGSRRKTSSPGNAVVFLDGLPRTSAPTSRTRSGFGHATQQSSVKYSDMRSAFDYSQDRRSHHPKDGRRSCKKPVCRKPRFSTD